MSSWIDKLKAHNKTLPSKSPAENDREADVNFLKLLEVEKDQEESQDPTFKQIPKFFFKKPQGDESLFFRVRQEARTRFLQNKTAEVLEKEDLEQLWHLLKDHLSQPDDGTERINYDQFVYVSTLLPAKCRQFFTASTFLKFERDEFGRIEIVPFFHFVVRKVNLFQTRIQISLYDSYGYGYLKEKDLENYIFELMPTFPQLENLTEPFYPFYVITSVRKFFFFLDPKRTGKIQIKDMMTSPILAELYELRQQRMSPEDQVSNWFSVNSSLRVYDQYLKLDTDKNGMLKKTELARYAPGLTQIFIDRVFEEFQTFEGEMDYKTFLDFVLAMENKKSPQALQYFWRVLDVYHKGAIDTFVINMFFRQVIQKLEKKIQTEYKVDDLKDELWDMAKPASTHCITLQDLVKCGVGHIVVSMLIDAKAFYDYDQRETGGDPNETFDDLDQPPQQQHGTLREHTGQMAGF